jgi:hypothetical protein
LSECSCCLPCSACTDVTHAAFDSSRTTSMLRTLSPVYLISCQNCPFPFMFMFVRIVTLVYSRLPPRHLVLVSPTDALRCHFGAFAAHPCLARLAFFLDSAILSQSNTASGLGHSTCTCSKQMLLILWCMNLQQPSPLHMHHCLAYIAACASHAHGITYLKPC